MATNYDINYDDERFTQVEKNKQEALSELEQTYAGMIGESDKYYQAQIDASKQWADTQSKLQQDNTDFTIEQIEQQKGQAQKDYTKEQSGAYVDWQKQSNQYGVEAEKTAAAGLAGTGYSESAQVSMYNTYQNRVTTAREVYNQAVMNYNNAIKDARLQNNAALAEIAYQALQTQLELSLEGFQYKNNLIIEQANKKLEVENLYHSYYLDVLNQINTENALAEEVRQFDANIAFQTEQAELDRQFQAKQAEIDRQFESAEAALDRQFKEAQAALDREHDKALLAAKNKQEKEMAEKEYQYKVKLLEKELANEKAVIEAEKKAQLAVLNKQNPGSGSSGSSSAKWNPQSAVTGSAWDKANNQVSTPYYQGKINSDVAKFGAFSNGYQPKGISGHGALSKTGDTIQFQTQQLNGQKQTVTQTVWKAADGTLWYWEGRENKYKQIRTGGDEIFDRGTMRDIDIGIKEVPNRSHSGGGGKF